MSRVQALTRIDQNSPQFKALREQALKLGSETQFTAGDAASGQAFLAMAGFTPQAIQAALPGVLSMATAGGMDLGETADIGSNILTQFGLSADQMDRVGDTLTAAFTRTNTDLRALGETMKYAGPVAGKLGISLEQAAAMAGVLANMGIRGSDAGTAMRASLARLASPPKAAAEALKELGVAVSDANGKMRPMEDLLADLYKATRKYGEVDRVSFFKDIAGEEAFTSFMALVDAAGDGSLPKLRKELEGARGEAERTAKVMANNLDGDLKSLGSAWEGVRIRIADLIDGPQRSVTQWAHAGGIEGDGAGAGPSGTDAPATGCRRCSAGNDCNHRLVVAGYWCACWPTGKTASWFFPPDRIIECCQGSACIMGNGDGFHFVTGRRYRGAVQSGRIDCCCVCGCGGSHLEILGTHQGVLCRGVQWDYGTAGSVARNL
ncbi:tail protein (modular protein) [Escherichia coli]|nr:tail protein (modular protein) [Escherichia coli]